MCKISLAMLLLLIAAFSTGSVFAQANASASLQGTVTDKSGGVIPNAEVKVSSKETGLTRSAVTSNQGLYRFELLPAGQYEVRIAAAGFTTMAYENVTLSVSQTTTVDSTMAPKQLTEIITVESSGAPMLDTTKSDVSLAVNTKMVQDLPMNGRDFVNLAILAPGARQVNSYDPTKNRIGVFATNGSSGRNVNVTINGIDNKDNTVGGPVMQLPLEAILEFNIATQRFSASNGRSEGAAINVITKSGTNDFHGSLYFFDRNEAFNTKNALEDTKGPYSRQQFGGSIGGPVKKDKTFLFFALERAREQTEITVDPASYAELVLAVPLGALAAKSIPTPYFDWRYNGRLDHRINEKNNVFVSYSNQNNAGINDQSGSNNDLTAGNFTTNQLIIANATLNTTVSPSIVNSFTAGYQYWNNLIATDKYSPTFNTPLVTWGTNTNVPQQSYQVKWQFKDDVSIIRGRHTFKMGFDYLWEPKLGGFFIYNPTPAITFQDDPSVVLGNKTLYPQGFSTPGAVTQLSYTSGNPYFFISGKMFGTYFQDDFRVSRRLSVNLGVRWDRDFGLFGNEQQNRNRAFQLLKAIGSGYGGAVPHDDKKNFSPRVGMAYDLTGHGKHILRAGYGLYFGQTFQNIPLFMLQQANSTLFTQFAFNSAGFGDTNADFLPNGIQLSKFRYGIDSVPATPPPPTKANTGDTANIVDPKYRNPYTQQFNAGYAWLLTDSQVVEVEYIHVLGLHENKNININPKLPSLNFARPFDALFAAKGLPVLANITDSQSIGRSRYDGLNISYRKRLSHRFTVNTNYVFSKGVAYNGAAASYSIRPSDILNIFGKQDFGPVPSDERHRWVVSGVVELPFGFRISPIMQIASARPYNPTQGISWYGYGSGLGASHAVLLKSDPTNYQATKGYSAAQLRACVAGGTCTVASYNALRGQRFFQLDTRFSKQLKFRERMVVDLFFQAFDLTDRANFGNTFSGNIRSGSFRQPTGFITPNGVIVPRSFSGEFGTTFRF